MLDTRSRAAGRQEGGGSRISSSEYHLDPHSDFVRIAPKSTVWTTNVDWPCPDRPELPTCSRPGPALNSGTERSLARGLDGYEDPDASRSGTMSKWPEVQKCVSPREGSSTQPEPPAAAVIVCVSNLVSGVGFFRPSKAIRGVRRSRCSDGAIFVNHAFSENPISVPRDPVVEVPRYATLASQISGARALMLGLLAACVSAPLTAPRNEIERIGEPRGSGVVPWSG